MSKYYFLDFLSYEYCKIKNGGYILYYNKYVERK